MTMGIHASISSYGGIGEGFHSEAPGGGLQSMQGFHHDGFHSGEGFDSMGGEHQSGSGDGSDGLQMFGQVMSQLLSVFGQIAQAAVAEMPQIMSLVGGMSGGMGGMGGAGGIGGIAGKCAGGI